jgi:transposase
MLTIGVDAHKSVHQALALDADGSILGQWRGPNTAQRWQRLLSWAQHFPGPRHWGIEGAWNYGRGLAQFLVSSGDVVFEVNPRWTAERRRRSRKPDKNDRLDAFAVAKLVRDEETPLPQLTAEDASSVLDLLVTEREALLAEATRLRNQLHHLLLQLSPECAAQMPSLTSEAGLLAVERYSLAEGSCLQQQRLAACHRLVHRLRLATEQAAMLEGEICSRAKARYLPLTELKGVQLLTAGA